LPWEAEVIRSPITGINRTVAIVAVVLAATALCWLSWRAGSPLLDGIRAIDVELELRNLQTPIPAPLMKP
jgi:hypothetical protein